MCRVANPFAGSKTRGQTKEKELILWKKERKKEIKWQKYAKTGYMKQHFKMFNANSTGFLLIWVNKRHPVLCLQSSFIFYLPCLKLFIIQTMLQNNLISSNFQQINNWTLIVRCENSVKIWRENVRLYSWRENKHGWLSHWQQRLLGALAAVDKVTGYQSGLKAVRFLSLCAYTTT